MIPTLSESPVLSFKVEGTPIPQGSKSALPGRGKAKGRTVLVEGGNRKTKRKPADRLKRWRELVGRGGNVAMRETGARLLNEPLVLGAIFIMPRPIDHITKATQKLERDRQRLKKSAAAFPGFKPDLSKLIRAVEDALEGVVYKNDSRIIGYREPWKFYDDDEPAGVRLEIWRLKSG